jgi:hypothetical protein
MGIRPRLYRLATDAPMREAKNVKLKKRGVT